MAVGWVLSPGAVPIYDGVGQPDEPYRYVAPPDGATLTADATTATGTSPIRAGGSTNGLSVATTEKGPQFSLFLPPGAIGGSDGTLTVTVSPAAPTEQPTPSTIDGNVYVVALASTGGPVVLTDKATIATLYLRATSQADPPPTVFYRPNGAVPWVEQTTSRGGFDVYVASFVGPGEYAVAHAPAAATSGGLPVLPLVLIVTFLGLVGVVVAVRLRAPRSSADLAVDADAPTG